MGDIHELSLWPFLWFGLPGRLLKTRHFVIQNTLLEESKFSEEVQAIH